MVKGSSWYGKVYTVIYFAAIYLTFILNLVFYNDAQVAYTAHELTAGGAVREYAIIILMYLIALAGIWCLVMYTIEYFRIKRRELAKLSNMPQGLKKADQAKWIREYEAKVTAEKKAARAKLRASRGK